MYEPLTPPDPARWTHVPNLQPAVCQVADALERVPVRPLPDESLAVSPAPSMNSHRARSPFVGTAGGVAQAVAVVQ